MIPPFSRGQLMIFMEMQLERNLCILACISSCKSRRLWPLDLMRTYWSVLVENVRSHIFYPINTLQIESKGYGIKLATACALNEQEINNERMSTDVYYFLFCIHSQLISRYSLEHVLLQTHVFSGLEEVRFYRHNYEFPWPELLLMMIDCLTTRSSNSRPSLLKTGKEILNLSFFQSYSWQGT